MLTKGITTGKPLLMAISLAFSLVAQAEDDFIRDDFFDKDDGQLDVGDWLGKQYGFLPTPIILESLAKP